MLKYLNIFKNLKLVKLVFAVLTSHLLLEEILVFRVVHSKFQIKSEMRGFPGAERILQLLNIAMLVLCTT